MQVTQLLRRAVQTNGRGLATICGPRRQSWQQFETRVARLACSLAQLGYRPGDRIGILALNSDRYLEYFFSLAWAGFVFVPVNTRLSAAEMTYWLGDSGATGLFVDDGFLWAVSEFKSDLPNLRHLIQLCDGPAAVGLLSYEQLIDRGSYVENESSVGDDLAGIFYTGGTTGRSKGVMMSNANLVFNALNSMPEFRFDRTTDWLHSGPMFHLADGAATFLLTAVGGVHSFIPRFEPGAFLAAVAEHRVTDCLAIPAMLNMIINHPDFPHSDLSSLRTIFYGASPMPEALLLRALDLMPHVTFMQAYGQTEAAPVMTLLPREFHTVSGPFSGRLRSAGLPTIGCEVRILDENDREVRRGTVGEICGRGLNVMLGYWNQPDLTAVVLRNGWLHTGDGGTMDDDGFVYVVDRLKDMIISGGENVYSSEVEQAIYQHAAVLECAVIGVPDDHWGERVHAIVRLKPDATATEEDLVLHCRNLIAHFKCPRSIAFRDDPLPLSGAGKILKSDLRRPFWEGHDRQVH